MLEAGVAASCLLGLVWAYFNWSRVRSVKLHDSGEESHGTYQTSNKVDEVADIGSKIRQGAF